MYIIYLLFVYVFMSLSVALWTSLLRTAFSGPRDGHVCTFFLFPGGRRRVILSVLLQYFQLIFSPREIGCSVCAKVCGHLSVVPVLYRVECLVLKLTAFW